MDKLAESLYNDLARAIIENEIHERVLLLMPYGNVLIAVEKELESNPDNYDLQIKAARARDEFHVMERKNWLELDQITQNINEGY
jgi:hypothetical protein